jgi:DNA invertase Pin-like site-specific DNA recombinase
MRMGYVRVSTLDQNTDRQIKALQGYKIDKLYIEQVSAKDTNRPQLQEMLSYARDGDTIYITDFSRLARSTKDLLNLVEQLNDKNVRLVSLKENIDSSTSTGKLMLTMIGAINEFERNNLLERQKEGIAIAKEQGKYKGSTKLLKPKNFDMVYQNVIDGLITNTRAIELLGLKRNTYYRFVKDYKNNK